MDLKKSQAEAWVEVEDTKSGRWVRCQDERKTLGDGFAIQALSRNASSRTNFSATGRLARFRRSARLLSRIRRSWLISATTWAMPTVKSLSGDSRDECADRSPNRHAREPCGVWPCRHSRSILPYCSSPRGFRLHDPPGTALAAIPTSPASTSSEPCCAEPAPPPFWTPRRTARSATRPSTLTSATTMPRPCQVTTVRSTPHGI